jgi:hypothetical protein
VVSTARPVRRKDADGDYDGPAKTASVAPAAPTAVTNGKVDTHV